MTDIEEARKLLPDATSHILDGGNQYYKVRLPEDIDTSKWEPNAKVCNITAKEFLFVAKASSINPLTGFRYYKWESV